MLDIARRILQAAARFGWCGGAVTVGILKGFMVILKGFKQENDDLLGFFMGFNDDLMVISWDFISPTKRGS